MFTKKQSYTIIFVLFILLLSLRSADAVTNTAETRPLYLLFLIDSSGSMQNTDPAEIRKLASEAVVTFLSDDDMVSVVEFDSNAKTLLDWTPAADRDDIFKAINRVGKDGDFTDFRAGLEEAAGIIAEAPNEARKVILLLSDGVFEPNPRSIKYSPYDIQYWKAVSGRSRNERQPINEEYRRRLTPVARGIIDRDVIPVLVEKGVEVYTVGLSHGADRDFLEYIAESTSNKAEESHAFYANEAVDLMDAFLEFLHLQKNKITLHTESGFIEIGEEKEVYLDTFLKDIRFIVLSEEQAGFTASSVEQTGNVNTIPVTHPQLQILELDRDMQYGSWQYGFNQGRGRYNLLITGTSSIDMDISEISNTYGFGEQMELVVNVFSEGRNILPDLPPGTRVEAKLIWNDLEEVDVTLKRNQDHFIFNYDLERTGVLKLKFTLWAYDSTGQEILPRPSKMYQTKVLPRFYIEPDFVDFGDIEDGIREVIVKVHSGLPMDQTVKVISEITGASRCKDEPEMLPVISSEPFYINSNSVAELAVNLRVPEGGCYGYFEGKLNFIADNGNSFPVGFRVHVPSWLEWLTVFILISLLLSAIVFTLFLILWGNKKNPVGVLKYVKSPQGKAEGDRQLGALKRGFFKKHMNWKKNIITIGREHADIPLDDLPHDFRLEMVFHRFIGMDSLQNTSSDGSGHIVELNQAHIGIPFPREPGESYILKDQLSITVGGYKFIYENPKFKEE